MKHVGVLLRSCSTDVAIAQIARRGKAVMLGVVVLLSNGCYTYAAVPTTQPLVEQTAEFRINDAGRAELTRQLGPGTFTVEGRVVRQDENGWTLRVYRHIDLRGQSTTGVVRLWSCPGRRWRW